MSHNPIGSENHRILRINVPEAELNGRRPPGAGPAARLGAFLDAATGQSRKVSLTKVASQTNLIEGVQRTSEIAEKCNGIAEIINTLLATDGAIGAFSSPMRYRAVLYSLSFILKRENESDAAAALKVIDRTLALFEQLEAMQNALHKG